MCIKCVSWLSRFLSNMEPEVAAADSKDWSVPTFRNAIATMLPMVRPACACAFQPAADVWKRLFRDCFHDIQHL